MLLLSLHISQIFFLDILLAICDFLYRHKSYKVGPFFIKNTHFLKVKLIVFDKAGLMHENNTNLIQI